MLCHAFPRWRFYIVAYILTTILCSFVCDIVPECNTSGEAGNTTKLKVHWNNLRPDQVHEYTKCTNIELSQLIVPDGIRCRDPNCKSRIHQAEISELHDSIMGSLTACSQPLTAPNNRDIKQAIVPGWNEYVKEHNDAAMDAYWLWREMGKPRNGHAFTLMKLCSSKSL